METNRFYTLMLIPEKTSQVRRWVIPSWLAKTAAGGLAFLTLFGIVMFYDYWSVMSEISENKQLKMENRRLRQQVQVFKNKVATIESTMDRVKTFATRLKVITNIEDRASLLQSLNQNLPDASANIAANTSGAPAGPTLEQLVQQSEAPLDPDSPEISALHRDYQQLDERFALLNHDSLDLETELQDLYELLGDQKAFLSALPTRKPAIGYYTSGFGVRRSPIGGKIKMHEGLDIANHEGTTIHAPADGIVIFASIKSGYGQTVVLDHGYGLETWYGHTKRILVSRGQKVRRGDVIAQIGNSGRSTGPHVHYEVRVNGTPVDPFSYILEN